MVQIRALPVMGWCPLLGPIVDTIRPAGMAQAHSTPRATQLRVLFVSGLQGPEDASRMYRCVHHAKQLRAAGMQAEVVLDTEATRETVLAADVVIMARCKRNPANLALARAARDAGKLLCGELDDKVFEPWDVHTRGFLRSKSLIKRDVAAVGRVANAERNILSLLPMFEMVFVSTPGLKDVLAELGLRAQVVRNAIDTEVAKPVARARTQLRRILVMSGTRTHDADLRLITQPLARFLAENPAIICMFLGPFQLPGPLLGLPNVQCKERLPIAELHPFVADYDLCLVPLEDSLFNDCKSAIKFLECGLVSVPVVASPRREFRDLVRDGETGFLAADDPDAWYRTLCNLRDQPELLRKVAAQAHQDVLQSHTATSRGTALADSLKSLMHLHQEKARALRRV